MTFGANFYITLAAAAAAALMIWNVTRIRGYQRDWGYEGEIPGTYYPCDLRSADSEFPMQCRIGASDSAFYLMADPQALPTRTAFRRGKYGSFQSLFKSGLRVPWNELSWRGGSMFLKEVIWFENRRRRFFVYVPREIGEKVIRDAGREPPLSS